jgi:hypothetical protein
MTFRTLAAAFSLCTLLSAAGCANVSSARPAIVRNAYKDVSIGIDAGSPLIAALPASLRSVSWGFATGECGDERWGGFDTEAFARLNVEAYRRSGTGYIVSTGGEAGVFTCSSDQGMARMLARYDSPQLIGFDFDIEGKQTPEQIAALMHRIRWLQGQRPALRISFTLATFASSDGSGRSLNALGERTLRALREAGIEGAVINLMVMNYGPAGAANCVVKDARCDMGASALQAARNLHQSHGVPLSQIALTAMLGVNDVVSNVFTPADAQALARGARQLGLAGLHFWSLDRDKPCPGGAAMVSPNCHGLAGIEPWSFTKILLAD